MKNKINEIRGSIRSFLAKMVAQNIDYRLGLVTFSDVVERVTPMTDSIETFQKWLDSVIAEGGGDEKENALEGLRTAANFNFRPNVNRIAGADYRCRCDPAGRAW